MASLFISKTRVIKGLIHFLKILTFSKLLNSIPNLQIKLNKVFIAFLIYLTESMP